MLFQLGTVLFEVAPVNIASWERKAAADFAVKDTMGNVRDREFMGPGDESIELSGTLYPDKLGGLSSVAEMDKLRASGNSQILVRGDGSNMGWFKITDFSQSHTFLDERGVGKKIEFSLSLVAAPKPSAASYLSTLVRLFSSAAGF